MRVGLVAAMPEECAPLLRRVGAYEKVATGRYPLYAFRAGGHEACLVRSGMGSRRAAEAARFLVDRFRPEVILSFGFGGGVLPGPAVGDMVVADRLFRLRDGHLSEQPALSSGISEQAWLACAALPTGGAAGIHRGTFITTDGIENKRDVAERLPSGLSCPVLEMETCAVADVAFEEGVPFAAIRGISDGADEELGFSIAEFTDADLNIRIPKVLLTVLRKPWIVPQLVRLARNIRTAGEGLADAILTLLERLQCPRAAP